MQEYKHLSEIPISIMLDTAQLYEIYKVVKFLEAESRIVVARGLGEGTEGSCCLIGIASYHARWKCSGDLLYNKVHIVKNLVLYI